MLPGKNFNFSKGRFWVSATGEVGPHPYLIGVKLPDGKLDESYDPDLLLVPLPHQSRHYSISPNGKYLVVMDGKTEECIGFSLYPIFPENPTNKLNPLDQWSVPYGEDLEGIVWFDPSLFAIMVSRRNKDRGLESVLLFYEVKNIRGKTVVSSYNSGIGGNDLPYVDRNDVVLPGRPEFYIINRGVKNTLLVRPDGQNPVFYIHTERFGDGL